MVRLKTDFLLYLVHTPSLIQRFFDGYTWQGDADEDSVYITFDDGPIPEVTPWVLDTLADYDAKATFFCVGDNVVKHNYLYERLLAEGHAVGNHTFNHLNGWSTSHQEYLANVERCAEVVDSPLFRPPYGRLSYNKAQLLRRRFRIVMWDVLSGDFDPELSEEACLQNVLEHTRPGSIIVFHDSLKAERNLRYTLPRCLEALAQKGYSFRSLNPQSQAICA